jgi:riboflavin kinase / FMN adenylyltransferase
LDGGRSGAQDGGDEIDEIARPADDHEGDRGVTTVSGIVEVGQQLGRKLGFPTANLRISESMEELGNGVYAAWMRRPDGTLHPAAASLGVRPTVVEDGERLLEVHVLDADEWIDLYGERIDVALVELLRPEERFDNLDALVAQIGTDCDRARQVLGAAGPPSA